MNSNPYSSSTHLFRNVPASVGDVFSTVFHLFIGNWKPLVLLTLAQFGSWIVTVLVLVLVTFIAAASYIQTFMAMLKNLQNQGGYGRHLLDYSTGISGASRLLGYYGQDQDYNNYNDSEFTAGFIITMIFMYFLWAIIICLVTGVFTGAYTHTLAEIYAGGTPTLRKSLRHGIGNMCKLFTYLILLILAITGLYLIIVIPTSMLALANDPPNYGAFFLGALVFIVVLVIVSAGLTAAIPSIVVEKKTAVQAFGRSWALCKNFICFILCCQFTYNLVLIVVLIVINMVLNKLPDFFALIGHSCVSILTSSIAPVFCFVLYMSVRIRTDNITQEDLALEIDSNVSIANAVEMNAGTKDSRGEYSNIIAKRDMV